MRIPWLLRSSDAFDFGNTMYNNTTEEWERVDAVGLLDLDARETRHRSVDRGRLDIQTETLDRQTDRARLSIDSQLDWIDCKTFDREIDSGYTEMDRADWTEHQWSLEFVKQC